MSAGPKTLILHRSWNGPRKVKELDTPKHSNKKNTKKWCKGKVGREHVTEWKYSCEIWGEGTLSVEEYLERAKDPLRVEICKVCGKHMRWKSDDKDNNNKPPST